MRTVGLPEGFDMAFKLVVRTQKDSIEYLSNKVPVVAWKKHRITLRWGHKNHVVLRNDEDATSPFLYGQTNVVIPLYNVDDVYFQQNDAPD